MSDNALSAPVFVTGTQRSGTTLLFQILNSHPDLDVVNELDQFYFFVGRSGPQVDLPGFLGSSLHVDPSQLSQPADQTAAFDQLERAFQLRAEHVGKTRWGIKDPHLTYVLDSFQARYPDAKFIFTLRDPRAVVNSYIERPFNICNVFAGAHLWAKEVNLQFAFRERFPQQSLLVRYEDLIGRKEETITDICKFLGVSLCDEMLSFHRQGIKTVLHAGTENLSRDVDPTIVDKWKRSLSRRQVRDIEYVVFSLTSRTGYFPSLPNRNVSSLKRVCYAVHQYLMSNYLWQKHSNWYGVRRRLDLGRFINRDQSSGSNSER